MVDQLIQHFVHPPLDSLYLLGRQCDNAEEFAEKAPQATVWPAQCRKVFKIAFGGHRIVRRDIECFIDTLGFPTRHRGNCAHAHRLYIDGVSFIKPRRHLTHIATQDFAVARVMRVEVQRPLALRIAQQIGAVLLTFAQAPVLTGFFYRVHLARQGHNVLGAALVPVNMTQRAVLQVVQGNLVVSKMCSCVRSGAVRSSSAGVMVAGWRGLSHCSNETGILSGRACGKGCCSSRRSEANSAPRFGVEPAALVPNRSNTARKAVDN